MALRTFLPPIPPSPGTEDKPEFKVLAAEFGDGYTQTAEDGLNNVRRVLSLTWEFMHPNHAGQITRFIKEHKGTRAFLYTPSDEAEPVRWTCKELGDKRLEGGFRQVTATLREDFNLDE